MDQADAMDEIEYERRFQSAIQAFDTAAVAVRMARHLALVRTQRAGPSLVLAGANHLPAARRVGLLASSMNPLTRAHVALAEAARQVARLDALCWVATLVTVDKEYVERASLADRLTEATLYAQAAGDGLLLLEGGLYVEQARAAHALLSADAEIVLIVGFDKIVQIFDPHYYSDRDAALRELFSEAELVVAPRAGSAEADLRALLSQPQNHPFAERVRYCPLPARYAIDSSSEARALARSEMAGVEKASHLRDLLTPEGLALTLGAQPYAPAQLPGAADLGDVYSARQTLIAALSDIDPSQLTDTPELGRLVNLAADVSPRGSALRAWARASGRHTHAGLRVALASG